jgi:N-acetylmuramoyl-L-alanine amidase CwlA
MSDYIWIEGNQAHTSGGNGPVTRVVIHATVSPCETGGARKVARYFQSDQAGGLAHFVVDPTETVQCCREDVSAHHAPPNKGSIGVELCDPQEGSVERWYDPLHRQMLLRAAVLVADLCKRHDLPMVFVRAPGLKSGQHGITRHQDVSEAFRKSTHTDPGSGFPMEHFVDLVRAAQGKPTPPTPKPTPAPVPMEDNDMAVLIKADNGPRVYITNWITKRWVQTTDELHTLIAGGVPGTVHKVSPAVLNAIKEA